MLLRVATLRSDDELVPSLLRAGAPPLLAKPLAVDETPLLTDEEEAGETSCLLIAARYPMNTYI